MTDHSALAYFDGTALLAYGPVSAVAKISGQVIADNFLTGQHAKSECLSRRKLAVREQLRSGPESKPGDQPIRRL